MNHAELLTFMRNSILSDLEKSIDTGYRTRLQDHFKMDVSNFLGVPTPIVRKISLEWFRSMKDRSLTAVLSCCEELLQTNIYECKIIAFDWSYRCRNDFEADHINVFDKWLHLYVKDWSDCDDLCTHSLGFLIAQYPDVRNRIFEWPGSPNRWIRRASAVSLIYGLRRNQLLKEAFTIAERLFPDTDYLVQKGCSWMLREASKSYPDEVSMFILRHRDQMPRAALRNAVGKLPAMKKREILEGVP